MFLGDLGRKQAVDINIFKYPQIDRISFNFKELIHRPRLSKLCALVPVKFGNEIRILRGAIFLYVQIVLPYFSS